MGYATLQALVLVVTTILDIAHRELNASPLNPYDDTYFKIEDRSRINNYKYNV